MATHAIELWCDNKGVVDTLSSKDPMALTEMTSAESDLLKVAKTPA